MLPTCLNVVSDGVVGADVESGEASELQEGLREPVLCDVRGGDEPVWEAQLLHAGLGTLWQAGVDKVQDDLEVLPAATQQLLGGSGQDDGPQLQFLHRRRARICSSQNKM